MSQVDTYIRNLPTLTDAELKKEKSTVSGLLTKAIRDSKPRRATNLEKMLAGVISEAQTRKISVSNPGETSRESYAGKLVRLTDSALQSERERLVKMLKDSKDHAKHFGTKGVALLKGMIKDAEKEMKSRGLQANPKKKKKKKGMSTAGRAAVGAGVGALALGPIGAVGLGYAATKYKPVKAKKNPLKKIPKGAKRDQIQKIISHNIAMEMEAGKPQKQAVAISIAEARRQSPTAALMYPERNPSKTGEMYKEHRVVFDIDDKGTWNYKTYKGARKVREAKGFPFLLGAAKDAKDWIDHNGKSKNPGTRYRVYVRGNYYSVETGDQPVKRTIIVEAKSKDEARKKAASRMTEMAREIGYDFEGQHRKFTAEKMGESRNPKKTKKKVSPAKALISKAQKLWDRYVERPGKKRLKDVFEHLGEMEHSAAKSVKDELRRAKRVAKAEAKRLKMKV